VNSAPPPSSAAQATRRERNRNQSSNPVDGRVEDTDHHTSQQVNVTSNHGAADNLRTLRRQLCLDPVRRDRPQPAAHCRRARRRPNTLGPRIDSATQDHQRSPPAPKRRPALHLSTRWPWSIAAHWLRLWHNTIDTAHH
jgi:hypothetical protein